MVANGGGEARTVGAVSGAHEFVRVHPRGKGYTDRIFVGAGARTTRAMPRRFALSSCQHRPAMNGFS
jgi:hypothetical protein